MSHFTAGTPVHLLQPGGVPDRSRTRLQGISTPLFFQLPAATGEVTSLSSHSHGALQDALNHRPRMWRFPPQVPGGASDRSQIRFQGNKATPDGHAATANLDFHIHACEE